MDATLEFYNSPGSVQGEWYVFIFDQSDKLIAHADQDLIGMDLKEELGVDSTGYRFGDVMLGATEQGLWVDYIFLDPATASAPGHVFKRSAFRLRLVPDASHRAVEQIDSPRRPRLPRNFFGMDLKEELGVDSTGYRFGDVMPLKALRSRAYGWTTSSSTPPPATKSTSTPGQ